MYQFDLTARKIRAVLEEVLYNLNSAIVEDAGDTRHQVGRCIVILI